MPTIEPIPYQSLPQQSDLFLAYTDQAPEALCFYQVLPDMASLESAVPHLREWNRAPRREMAPILERQNRRFGCGDRTLEHMGDLTAEDCVAVVTGQQVGLFTGPLYTVYKALTAVQVARELRDRGVKAVPVFWMDTEDHDLAEVTFLTVPGPDGGFLSADYRTRLFQRMPSGARPVGTVRLPDSIDAVVDEYMALLRGNRHFSETKTLLAEAYRAGRTFTDAFAIMMSRLFENLGLVLFDPHDPEVKKLAAGVFAKAVSCAWEIQEATRKRDEELVKAGYHTQIRFQEDSTVLFYSYRGKRRAVTHKEDTFALKHTHRAFGRDELLRFAESHPERFSPNVRLRPILQDHLFPTLVYVGGPAEVSYFAQLEPLYRIYQRPMPAIWPRNSFTLIEPGTDALMVKHGISFADCISGAELVQEKILGARRNGPCLTALLEDLEEEVRHGLQELRPTMVRTSGSLGPALDTVQRKIQHNVGRLRGRALRLETQGDESVLKDAAYLMNRFLPNGRLQERELGAPCLLSSLGPGFIETLNRLAPLDGRRHYLVNFAGSARKSPGPQE